MSNISFANYLTTLLCASFDEEKETLSSKSRVIEQSVRDMALCGMSDSLMARTMVTAVYEL